MPAEGLVFEEFLVVVGHSNEIKFSDTVVQMYSGWMYISENQSLLVYVIDSVAQLSEYGNGLPQCHLSFAE